MSVKPGRVTNTVSDPVVVADDNGQLVEVSGTVTTRAGGMVFLADVTDLITGVQCHSDDETIVIQFENEILDSDVGRMFPTDAVLVVREQDYGACFGGAAGSPIVLGADGFLEIQSASLLDSNSEVSITGTRTAFYGMFEDASVTIANVEEIAVATREGAKVSGTQSRPTTLSFSEDLISNPSISATVSGSLTDRSDVTVVNADFGVWGFDFTFRFVEDFDIRADFVTSFQASASPSPFEAVIIEPIMLGPPLKRIVKLLRKAGLIDEDLANAADIQVGLFFEMNFKLEVNKLSVSQTLGPFVDFDYSSGRTVTDINVFLKVLDGADMTTTVVSDLSSSSNLELGFNGLEGGENTDIDAEIVALFLPQVSLYLTENAFAGLNLPFGFQLNADSPDLREPTRSATSLPLLIGCDVCHRFEAELLSRIDQPRFVGKIDLEFSILGFDILPYEVDEQLLSGSPLTAPIVTYCAFPDEEITCDEMCCDAKPNGSCHPIETVCCYAEDECCVDSECDGDETCISGTCSGCSLESNECCIDEDCSGAATCQSNSCLCAEGFKECDDICIPMSECCPSDRCCDDPCCGSSSCDQGGANGDPHMLTFDGLRFSCQAAGDFVLVQSAAGLSVHVRFRKKSPLVSLASAVAVRGGDGETLIEVVLPETGATPIFRVSGVETIITDVFEDEFVRVYGGSTVKIFLKGTSVSVEAGIRLPSSFPHFNVRMTIPPDYSSSTTFSGLLGSPDGDPSNDWTSVDGSVLPIPTTYSELSGQQGYEYCISEWCIRTEAESLFTYEDNSPFDGFGCDAAFPGAVDVGSASAALRELCGNDEACLVDGLELGEQGALSLLEAESQVGSSSRFQISPSAVTAGASVNLILTFDLSASSAEGVEAFEIRRVNSFTRVVDSTVVTRLFDVGLGVGNDTVAGDMIFSNALAFLAETAGESFGFQAVPIIDGVPQPSSALTTTALSAVRSYSAVSGIGAETQTNSSSTLFFETLDDLTLVVQYSWPSDVADLDTGTLFLGAQVGFGCSSGAPFLDFTGDNTFFGGTETARARLGDALAAGSWSSSTEVFFRAGWFSCTTSRGPMTVTVFTERPDGAGGIIMDGNAISFVAFPGCQDGCAQFDVGSARIDVASDGSATIVVSPPSV